jgi:hypothetical protein
MHTPIEKIMYTIRGRLEMFESRLPKNVEGSGTSKLPFKVSVYRAALIWRIVELGRAAFDEFEKDRLVAGIVLTRAVVETSAALWYLCAKVQSVVASENVGDIDTYLMKMVAGVATGATKEDEALPRPIRVSAFLERTEKDIEGFSHQYGILSEYAHPNWAGTVLLYCEYAREGRMAELRPNIRENVGTKRIGVGNLSMALLTFERSFDRIRDLQPAFIALCESSLKNKQTGTL